MKKIISLFIIITVLFLSCTAIAEGQIEKANVAIEINGIRVGLFDNQNNLFQIYTIDDMVYVPLFPILESLGIEYSITENKISIVKNMTNNPAETSEKKGTRVDITEENFKEYFDVSVDVWNVSESNLSYSLGLKKYTLSGSVTLSVVAKYPCELNNVEFGIVASGGRYIGSARMDDKNLSFNGTVPQSGSFSSTKEVSFSVTGGIEDDIKYYVFSDAIKSASGYIIIDGE